MGTIESKTTKKFEKKIGTAMIVEVSRFKSKADLIAAIQKVTFKTGMIFENVDHKSMNEISKQLIGSKKYRVIIIES